MDAVEVDRQYPEVVTYAVQFLLNLHQDKASITEGEVDKAVSVASVLYASVLDTAHEGWLRRDIAYIVEELWDTLKDKKNRGRVSEIVRGALR